MKDQLKPDDLFNFFVGLLRAITGLFLYMFKAVFYVFIAILIVADLWLIYQLIILDVCPGI